MDWQTPGLWLYFRFPLSFRLVEEMLLEREIVVSYESIRRWSLKFGAAYARSLHRKAAGPDDIWHLDEVRIVIRDQVYWLWRAVDQDGYVLDETCRPAAIPKRQGLFWPGF